MTSSMRFDVCVIGAGSAGLSVASGTAQLGLSTALIEHAEMGGDCLNTGCVPSKALLSVTRSRSASADRAQINAYVRNAQAAIAPHDSQERFEGMGVTVIRQSARFIDETTVVAGKAQISAGTFVIATGSRAAVPPIPGIDPARILTNETVFGLERVPEHLVVIGGGPIGMEMAQAHRQMGSRVTVLERDSILPKDDPDLVAILRARLASSGIDIVEGADVQAIDHKGPDSHAVQIADGDATRTIEASHILVAAGRAPNIENLGLDKAGVDTTKQGITVDARLRTTNTRIFALGDAAGGPQFTHIAGYHGGIAVQNIAFRLPAKVDYSALPWVTYTDPELAHVGMTPEQARDRHGSGVSIISKPFSGLDRAQTSGGTDGLIKVSVTPKGKILGCSIVGPHAGELIGLWALAITKSMTLRDLTRVILPYPTYGEIAKQVASDFYRPKLFNDRTRTLVKWLQKLPRF